MNTKTIIYSDNSTLIANEKDKLVIEFILPIDEMKKANGFFDYKAKDQILMKDKLWLNKTSISF